MWHDIKFICIWFSEDQILCMIFTGPRSRGFWGVGTLYEPGFNVWEIFSVLVKSSSAGVRADWQAGTGEIKNRCIEGLKFPLLTLGSLSWSLKPNANSYFATLPPSCGVFLLENHTICHIESPPISIALSGCSPNATVIVIVYFGQVMSPDHANQMSER